MRVAFLTPEFVTEHATGGGLGNYVYRMASAFQEVGCLPEVFTIGNEDRSFNFEGIRVHRVKRIETLGTWILKRVGDAHWRLRHPTTLGMLRESMGLARALKQRERLVSIDLVHSSDYRASGIFVRSNGKRPHAVRCSWAADLFVSVDGAANTSDQRWQCRLERLAIRRADCAYAPSEYVAQYFTQKYGYSVRVIRPPAYVEVPPAETLPFELPERFLVHFGLLGRRKGTDVLMQALLIAWKQEPGITVILAGKEHAGWRYADAAASGGTQADRVTYLGALKKNVLYAVVKKAAASVLPSRADNLPNTVIESLLMGIPVVGSAGASIDELVKQGQNGWLVPIGDADALAKTLVDVWRGSAAGLQSVGLPEGLREEMTPHRAVQRLLHATGVGSAS